MNLKKTLFLLPNAITLASIFCGFDAIRIAAEAKTDGEFFRAALLIVFAAVFDTLDGRVARATKTQSAFGLQIDSFADVVAFGAAPAFLVYEWSLKTMGSLGFFLSFVFVACGAIRLARFNVLSMREKGAPSKPGKYIVGLPIPGAAGILVAIVLASHASDFPRRFPALLASVVVCLSALMVSTVRFRSFKDMRLNARTVALVAFVIGSSAAISAYLRPTLVLVWIIGGYVLMGVVESALSIPKAIARRRARVDQTEERASSPG